MAEAKTMRRYAGLEMPLLFMAALAARQGLRWLSYSHCQPYHRSCPRMPDLYAARIREDRR